jgi:hypothetical protein
MADVVSLRSRRLNEGKDEETLGRKHRKNRLGKLSEEQEAFAAGIAQKNFSELTKQEKDRLLEIFAVTFGLVKG